MWCFSCFWRCLRDGDIGRDPRFEKNVQGFVHEAFSHKDCMCPQYTNIDVRFMYIYVITYVKVLIHRYVLWDAEIRDVQVTGLDRDRRSLERLGALAERQASGLHWRRWWFSDGLFLLESKKQSIWIRTQLLFLGQESTTAKTTFKTIEDKTTRLA